MSLGWHVGGAIGGAVSAAVTTATLLEHCPDIQCTAYVMDHLTVEGVGTAGGYVAGGFLGLIVEAAVHSWSDKSH